MTVFGHLQVFPVDYEAEASQRLLEASHCGDLKAAIECVANPYVDVNFAGAVCLKVRKADVSCRDESANEVHVGVRRVQDRRHAVVPRRSRRKRGAHQEITGNAIALSVKDTPQITARINLYLQESIGANVNQKLFRGFPTTAAVREGHLEILEILLKAGASQPACEEALLEASCHGRVRLSEVLMGSDLIRPHIAVHALVTACCRGFKDMVDTFIKCGVDPNATTRVLLQSYRPSLHTNVDCTALVAAVVSRQISVVRLLLQNGARTDIKVQLGAWSWDETSGEEFRVGAGLAEPYAITWCAVEYFEHSGAILRALLQQVSPNAPHYGRTLLHHAILCGNIGAVKVLLSCGAHVEAPVKTTQKTEFRTIHMAARLGLSTILKCLIDYGCDVDSRTDTGETALMISAKYKREECLKVLTTAGADFGLVNLAGQSPFSIAGSNRWSLGFQQAVLDIIRAGKVPKSSDASIFSPLMFVVRSGDVQALKALIGRGDINLDHQDDEGFSAVMVTAMEETAITLSEFSQKRDQFEKVMLEFALEKGKFNGGGFHALHCAARRGDLDAVRMLMHKGYNINVPDGDGYTPLMLAAREGHGCLKSGPKNDAERVIMDELARELVLSGALVLKHTKGGKGAPHGKVVKMVEATGMLRWGNSSRRNVICREVEVGPSSRFMRIRQKKGDASEPGVFRVVTMKNKEVHFVCATVDLRWRSYG
ncbi:hypothetical protein Acr_02g0014010 [Actinidia rufa]|uniref:Ankyrin repeat family protein n=1 Tax=Actinidia rufa TaxID=165716 RepID=A0A7J0E9I6_9ERIC|nr:hypothetical protein Acr_02g0014010 [Actinidia rufa]